MTTDSLGTLPADRSVVGSLTRRSGPAEISPRFAHTPNQEQQELERQGGHEPPAMPALRPEARDPPPQQKHWHCYRGPCASHFHRPRNAPHPHAGEAASMEVACSKIVHKADGFIECDPH